MKQNRVDFPPLYGKSKNGKIKVWEIYAKGDSITISHGYENSIAQTTTRLATGKNIGKANETTASEQAVLEAQSRYTKQQDKGYRSTKDELDNLPVKPMLAYPYDKFKDKVEFPCYTQPKINGVRCLASWRNGKLSLTSRELKPFTAVLEGAPSIVSALTEFFKENPNEVLDGELYLPYTMFGLEDTVSAVKAVGENTPALSYNVYDMVCQDDFIIRTVCLASIFTRFCGEGSPLVCVDTVLANSHKDIVRQHADNLSKGYEGTIVRKATAPYIVGARSVNLLKIKDFRDKEFKIVGATHSVNQEVIWICEHENGERFNVVPVGSLIERRRLWHNCDSYFGKYLTVKYSDVSKKGVPIGNPVGLCVRDYE